VDFFDQFGAQSAYEQFNDPNHPRHHVTHELVAGAAGFEAMRMYEQHRQENGEPVHHAMAKELLAGFAAAEIDRHFEGELLGHLDHQRARQHAQDQAGYLYDQQYGGDPGYGQQGGYDQNYDQQYGDPGYGQYGALPRTGADRRRDPHRADGGSRGLRAEAKAK
jgi:hypothetical protein